MIIAFSYLLVFVESWTAGFDPHFAVQDFCPQPPQPSFLSAFAVVLVLSLPLQHLSTASQEVIDIAIIAPAEIININCFI
jgi:hypothetical protein